MYRQWKKKHNQNYTKTINETEFINRCIYDKANFLRNTTIPEMYHYPIIRWLCDEELRQLQEEDQEPPLKPEAPLKPPTDEKPEDIKTTRLPPIVSGEDTEDTSPSQQSSDKNRTRLFNGIIQQLYTFDIDCDKAIKILSDNDKTIQLDASNDDRYTAIAVIGDKFYKGKFLPFNELMKSYKTMDGAYHDINHWGTTYPVDNNPNIEYIIGYQKNTRLDLNTKQMLTDIYIDRQHPRYQYWRSFIDNSRKAGRTPNVSVSFWASNKTVKADTLPVNYTSYGYDKNDDIEYLYDIGFQALSTVFQGACDDKDGCGIKTGYNQDNNINEDEAKKRKLKERIKELGGKNR